MTHNYTKPAQYRHFVSHYISSSWAGKETSNLVSRLTVASSSPRMTNHPRKGHGQLRDPIYILGPTTITLERLKLETSNFATGRMYQILAYGWKTTHKRGVVRDTWHIFNFDARNHIFGTTEAIINKFSVYVEYIKCYSLGMTDYPLMGVMVTWPVLKLCPNYIGTGGIARWLQAGLLFIVRTQLLGWLQVMQDNKPRSNYVRRAGRRSH